MTPASDSPARQLWQVIRILPCQWAPGMTCLLGYHFSAPLMTKQALSRWDMHMNRLQRKGLHRNLERICLVMSYKTEKTLFIPDLINIEFRDQDDKPLYQENILIGIKTIASHKNNINISPFLSDKKGYLRITKDQI